MTPRFIVALFALTIFASLVRLAVAADEASNAQLKEVVAAGTGRDENAALKQAFSNAVMQAVGTIVDAETIVKNDQVILDQVITASNAIVTHYDMIGAPGTDNGLVTVQIKATVEMKQLKAKLAAANVIKREVEGKDAFAQVVTELRREKDESEIVRRVFEKFPGNVLKAEPVGQPRIIDQSDSEATVGIAIRLSVDMVKYAEWQKAFLPILAKIAKESETGWFNPEQAHWSLLQRADKSFFPAPGSPISIPIHGYVYDDRGFGVHLHFKHSADDALLLVFQRQGSSRFTMLELDQKLGPELWQAASSISELEILLKDSQGNDIDGQQHDGDFVSRSGEYVSMSMSTGPWWLSNVPVGPIEPFSFLRNHRGWSPPPILVISPYCGDGHIFVPSFTYEFRFKLSLDQLKELKSVEARISSRRPEPQRQ